MRYLFFLLVLVSCRKEGLIDPPDIDITIEADSISFAAIGDYGSGNKNEFKVSEIVKSYNPYFIITMGDNNYEYGQSETLNDNIGDFYGDYIYNFDAPNYQQCNGIAFEDEVSRFFPTIGNHDVNIKHGVVPYLNYFSLPGNERFYDFIWGPVHFFAIDSTDDIKEQEEWFKEKLATSKQSFNVVYFHHSPYNIGKHGDNEIMQWDFSGVDLVFTGHDHSYQRFTKKDKSLPIYIVNGLGGADIHYCDYSSGSYKDFNVFCYNKKHGATLVSATNNEIHVEFMNINNQIIDAFTISK